MQKTAFALTLLWLAVPSAAHATLFQIDLSPLGGALNLGSTVYTQDHAIGVAAANETVNNGSPATGGEFGAGITYDDVTNLLSFDMAYGSAFGFVDLASDFNGGVHFHAPGAVNFPAANSGAGIAIDIGASHIASGTRSGRITGSAVLSAAQEADLFDNEIYLNIHSVQNGGGEIRGQLVPVPEPATAALAMMGLFALLICRWRRR